MLAFADAQRIATLRREVMIKRSERLRDEEKAASKVGKPLNLVSQADKTDAEGSAAKLVRQPATKRGPAATALAHALRPATSPRLPTALRLAIPPALCSRPSAIPRIGQAITAADAAHGCGLALSSLDRVKEAAARFQAALKLCPDRSESRLRLGMTLFSLDQQMEALVSTRRDSNPWGN